MKLSVSLTEGDVALLDRYANSAGLGSRSAAVQAAIRLLGDPDLQREYETAWEEWEESEDATLWDTTASDGLRDATR
ncbi:antitoxin [Arachnia propionica]|uniref:Antitoxin n=1 Tax=Arachnia propionica TaxID=1750 RepID=A0A3P1T1I2_9ACTN|nr:antitoxin [Arachnia propionica]